MYIIRDEANHVYGVFHDAGDASYRLEVLLQNEDLPSSLHIVNLKEADENT